ncbi:DNA/RNA non-specific endonuclease [Modestobacter versicolor]|uniref:DNA/RNA non-specific endonuclease n=1 Tax=Modestobacter versicolor TaxID=429133 RepID=A0A323V9U2_9ACTN|nr:DNA/RNA non-specific endonuclease [Modestobacter versicolor]MBB3677452.1 endonuclease G [Modestobacter versicolor]PZA20870.1 DNA/RNA non-specific endonuclease [Modestobacter versicolor]
MTTPADDLAGRTGLDEELLGVPVRLPALRDGPATVRLDYTHFSVLHRPDRRLAAVTGVGIDGALLQDLPREGIEWRLDPRLPAGQQTGPEVYTRNDLDRGHLVRRADAVWGTTLAEAQQGNEDTFHYTNAAPQAASFNQGEQLWLGLEEYLLTNAATAQRKLVVLTAPVLDPADPPYRGIRVPLRFVKVAAFVHRGELAATGYLLDQTPLVGELPGTAATDDAPPLGPFRTFQVPVADVAALTGLDLDQLAAVDRLPATVGADAGGPGVPSGWARLRTLAQVRWQQG